MYYTVYKITNKIDNKIYVGCHHTKDLNDGYMGSGKYIRSAIKMHGIDNFTKEILFIFDSSEEMYAKEAEIVNLKFLSEANTYNIKLGGFGGWDHENLNSDKQRAKCIKSNFKQNWLSENDPSWEGSRNKSKAGSENLKNAHILGKIKYDTFTGKLHTDATKIRIGLKNSEHQSGSKNSQYGTMWITNGLDSKKINKNDIIPDSWYKGRILLL